MNDAHDSVVLKIKTQNNIEINVPVPLSDMSEAERLAFLKFAASGSDKANLSPEERAMLEKGKVYASGDAAPEGIVCRWDWTCWAV